MGIVSKKQYVLAKLNREGKIRGRLRLGCRLDLEIEWEREIHCKRFRFERIVQLLFGRGQEDAVRSKHSHRQNL